MILTCEACSSRYMLDPASLGAVGRMVKCAKCGHKWYQEAPKRATDDEKQLIAAAIEEVKSAGRAERRLPVKVAEKKNIKIPAIAAGVAAVIYIIIGFFAYYTPISNKLAFTRGIYKSMGFVRTEGLRLKDVKLTKIPDNENNTYLLQGSIENTSAEERQMPIMRVNALNLSGESLKKWEFTKKSASLKPEEAIPFQTQITIGSPSLKYITLDIGNSFELSRRKY